MAKKLVWLVLSCLMVASLVLASCAPAVTEEEEVVTEEEEEVVAEEEVAVEEGPEMVTDSLGRLVEKPQYGGTITNVVGYMSWDPHGGAMPAHEDFTFEGLLFWDFTRGPSGTGEYSMDSPYFPFEERVGGIAESWEQPDEATIILHLRRGVRWQDSPLLNGREVVADDIVYSANAVQAHPRSLLYMGSGDPGWVVTALDKYTVQIVAEAPKTRGNSWFITCLTILPPEVEAAGLNWNDWRTSVGTGTGPYYVEDVVEGSSFLLARNPGYWRYDPLQPENKLPYPDYLKGLEITDMSTMLAALRTGKVDYIRGVPWTQRESLVAANPELQVNEIPGTDVHLYLRQDRGIFVDKRVRHAMNMAVDPDAIIRDLFGGDAEWWNFPLKPAHGPDIYTPVEELPAEIKEIYTYNPEKARQLLADAGYPNGFQIEVITYQSLVDILSIYKEYYKDVGIDLTIKLVEYGAFWNVAGEKKWDLICTEHGVGGPDGIWTLLMDGAHYWNYACVDDEHIEEVINNLPTALDDPDERNRQLKELGLYWAEKASYMNLPVASDFNCWQPWLKRQSGEWFIGTENGYYSSLIYAWVDQDLKYEMTGRR